MLVARTSQQSEFINRVRQLILSRPGHFFGIEYVARKLHLSSRTLRRRLKEEGSTFLEISNEIRFRLAKEYLETTTLPMEAIAKLLDYSDPENFTHAFKRWSGAAPRAYRRTVSTALSPTTTPGKGPSSQRA